MRRGRSYFAPRVKIVLTAAGPLELRNDEDAVVDAWSHMTRATGEKLVGWTSVLVARATRYRTRSMNFSRLKKRAATVRTSAEAGVLVASRLNHLEDTIREIVSS